MTRSFRSLSGAVVVVAVVGIAAGCSADLEGTSDDVAGQPSAPAAAIEQHTHPQDGFAHAPVRVPSIVSAPLHSPASVPSVAASQVEYVAGTSVDARILVLAGDGTEVDLPAITQTLDYMGSPYDVVITSTLNGGLLALEQSPGYGKYQGVILTTGELGYTPDGGVTWLSGLSPAAWQQLVNYEAQYAVRQATWYTYPTADLGFAAVDGATGGTTHVSFTAPGATVFSYGNKTAGTDVSQAWTYLAAAGTPTGGTATPLLVDSQNHALALVRTWADGRENLALTFDSNQYVFHALQLGYGVVNWVVRGVFVGEHKTYMSAQVDDLFLDDDQWPTFDSSTDGQGCIPSATQQCLAYRMSGSDLGSLVSWQNNLRGKPVTAAFRMDLAFNGVGSTTGYFANDTLTSKAKNVQSQFKWINHTWDHELLDPLTYAQASSEFAQNNTQAAALRLSLFSRQNIVTPELSGSLAAPVMQAMFDNGIRYMIADTSKPWIFGTAPINDATYNALQPSIMMIPRRPTNLYYNVTTQSEWVDEFNAFYAPGGRFCAPIHPETNCFAAPVTYAQLLDMESDRLVRYLLAGEAYPWMFHESNLRWNGSKGSLISSLIDATMVKYAKYSSLPVVSPTMDALGRSIANRMTYKASNVRATINGGTSITITSSGAAVVPITGLNQKGAEVYGGQYISRVTLPGNGASVTYALK